MAGCICANPVLNWGVLENPTVHSARIKEVITAAPVKWGTGDREVDFAHQKLLHSLPNFAILLRVVSFGLAAQEIADMINGRVRR